MTPDPTQELVVPIAMSRGAWLVILEAASNYDSRVPRGQGDGGECLRIIADAIEAEVPEQRESRATHQALEARARELIEAGKELHGRVQSAMVDRSRVPGQDVMRVVENESDAEAGKRWETAIRAFNNQPTGTEGE